MSVCLCLCGVNSAPFNSLFMKNDSVMSKVSRLIFEKGINP